MYDDPKYLDVTADEDLLNANVTLVDDLENSMLVQSPVKIIKKITNISKPQALSLPKHDVSKDLQLDQTPTNEITTPQVAPEPPPKPRSKLMKKSLDPNATPAQSSILEKRNSVSSATSEPKTSIPPSPQAQPELLKKLDEVCLQ
jgi:hypothetical protein